MLLFLIVYIKISVAIRRSTRKIRKVWRMQAQREERRARWRKPQSALCSQGRRQNENFNGPNKNN